MITDSTTLITERAASLIRLDIENQLSTLWEERGHISVEELWGYYTNYRYMPRLRDRDYWLRTVPRRLTAISETAESAPARIERGSDASLRQRLTLAHERIRELDDENRQLRNQIALLHGELRANRIADTHVTDSVHDANPQLTLPNSRPGPR